MSLDAAMAALTITTKPEKAQPKKGLLDLPAEIWSRIGKLAIDNHRTLTARQIAAQRKSVRHRWRSSDTLAWQPAITRTSRKLREELLPYYYRTKVEIYVHEEDDSGADVFDWRHQREAVGEWLLAMGSKNRAELGEVRYFSKYMQDCPEDLEWTRNRGLRGEWEVPLKLEETEKLDGKPRRDRWGQWCVYVEWKIVFLE